MNKNIVLIGFMGSGKSAVSRLLAKKLGQKAVSTDELIVQRQKLSIEQIFAEKGEKHFRALEREIVAELSNEKNLIIDCGGGIVLQQENIDDLKKSGITIYLKASVEDIYERTKNQKHRPLLNVENPQVKIKELLTAREPLYAQADYTIDTFRKTAYEVAEEIIRLTQ